VRLLVLYIINIYCLMHIDMEHIKFIITASCTGQLNPAVGHPPYQPLPQVDTRHQLNRELSVGLRVSSEAGEPVTMHHMKAHGKDGECSSTLS